MADMMELAPKAAQKIWSKGGDWKNLYVPKIKAIPFWFLYTEVTGRKSTMLENVSDIIEDNHEALEATTEAALAQYIKDDNIELTMEVAMIVREIDEGDTAVGGEEEL